MTGTVETAWCKHCGLTIVKRRGVWLHAEGDQFKKRTCAIDPYGFDASPHGEDCVEYCNGYATEGCELPEGVLE